MIKGNVMNVKIFIVGEFNVKKFVRNSVEKYKKINIYVIEQTVPVLKVVLILVIFLMNNAHNVKINIIQLQKAVYINALLIVKMNIVIKKMVIAMSVMRVTMMINASQNVMNYVNQLAIKKTEDAMNVLMVIIKAKTKCVINVLIIV
jgi:hypothetical protein